MKNLVMALALIGGSAFAQLTVEQFSYRREVKFKADASKDFVQEYTFHRTPKDKDTFFDKILAKGLERPIIRTTTRVAGVPGLWKEIVGDASRPSKITTIQVIEEKDGTWTKWKSTRASYECGDKESAACEDVTLFQKAPNGTVVGVGKTTSTKEKYSCTFKVWIKPIKEP